MSNNILYGAIALGVVGIGGYYIWKSSQPDDHDGLYLLADTTYYITYTGEIKLAPDAFGNAWPYIDTLTYWNESTNLWASVAANTIMMPNGHYGAKFTNEVRLFDFTIWNF